MNDKNQEALDPSLSSLDAHIASTDQDELELARQELAQSNDRLLRVQAELENVRKRAAREVLDQQKYAASSVLESLLAVVDNMERAVSAATTADAAEAGVLVDGFQLVTQQLLEVLSRNHCTKIEALGLPFDPNMHEAIGQQPSKTDAPGAVLTVVQDGYKLHDRVLRPARVIIAAPAQ